MASLQKFELGHTLMLMLEDFQRRLDEDLHARGARGVRSRHRAVFIHLDRHGASRSVELAAAAGIRPQSMMKTVHELEQLGLVSRCQDPTDSRAKLIEFTPAGQAFIEELSRSSETVWEQYAQVLGENELQRTITALSTLLPPAARGEQP
jgi:DNA-binding MarR family transcriptional regulator